MKGDTPLIESGTSDQLQLPAGAQWATFGPIALNSSGQMAALKATLTVGLGGVTKANATRIFLSTAGNFTTVAQTDSPDGPATTDAPGMPAGAKFSTFKKIFGARRR